MKSGMFTVKKIYLYLFGIFFALPVLGGAFDIDLLSVYKFALTVAFVFYIPGSIVLGAVKSEFSSITHISVSLITGLFISSEISKVFFRLGIQRYLWTFYIVVGICYIVLNAGKTKNTATKEITIDRYSFFMIGLCLLMTFVVWYVIFPSSLLYPEGMRFYRANAFDAMNQWAMSEELARSFPRQFPFWTGAPMVGYHIGAYYWRGLLAYLAHIEPITFFFRLRPLFITNLAMIVLFSVIKEIKNRKVAILSVLSIFFIGTLSWVFPLLDRILPFVKIDTVYFTGSFIQRLLFNPPLAVGILALSGSILFFSESKRKKSFLNIFLAGYFFGNLFSTKVFFGISLIISLFLLGLYEFMKEKDSLVLKIFLVSVIFSLIETYGMFTTISGTIFEFHPFYLVISMLREMGWQMSFITLVAGIIIFTIGSIGIKLPAFAKVISYIKRWRLTKSNDRLLIMSLVPSFLLAHSFTFTTYYKIATLNFYVLFLIVLDIYFSEWLTEFFENKRIFLKSLALYVVAGFVYGSSFFELLPYMPKYNVYKPISHEELKVFDFIRHNTEEDAIIIHNRKPIDWHRALTGSVDRKGLEDRDGFVSALGGRRVVLECSWHVGCGRSIENFDEALKERKKDIKILFSTSDKEQALDILNRYDVTYIWVSKGENLNFKKEGILKRVFSNEAATIYKVQK